MKQKPAQQALAALAILLVVAVTLTSGLLLATGDGPLAGAPQAARSTATATPYRLPTLPPGGQVAEVTPRTDVPSFEPPTVTLAPSNTPAPSDTPAPTTTLPPAPTATPQPLPSATPCQVRGDWVPYTVQAGDTLFRLALRTGETTASLQRGNCLPGTSLVAGQVLRVPPGQPRSVPTTALVAPPPAGSTPLPLPTAVSGDGSCTDTGSTISSPVVGGTLSGEVAFYGTATHPDLQLYKLELRQEGASGPQDFITAHTGYNEVHSGLLGTINTAAFPNGEYWVRLVVVDNTGNYPERCSRLYTFRN